MVTTPDPLSPAALRAAAEEWLVAATIATEVPPKPTTNPNSPQAWTAEAIPLAIRAVAEVIAVRAKTNGFPQSPLGVVLQLKQFSGVLRGLSLKDVGHRDIWIEAVSGLWFPEHVGRCLAEWRRISRDPETRIAGGATHYYSPVGMLPPGSKPSWTVGKTLVAVAGVPLDWFSFYR